MSNLKPVDFSQIKFRSFKCGNQNKCKRVRCCVCVWKSDFDFSEKEIISWRNFSWKQNWTFEEFSILFKMNILNPFLYLLWTNSRIILHSFSQLNKIVLLLLNSAMFVWKWSTWEHIHTLPPKSFSMGRLLIKKKTCPFLGRDESRCYTAGSPVLS